MASTNDTVSPDDVNSLVNGAIDDAIDDEMSDASENCVEIDEQMDLDPEDIENAPQGKFTVNRLPPSIRQNMMNEFTDVDTFVVSMDSLLIEIMCHDNLSWILGGQSLVVIYMIESFLKSLEEKGGRFHLVWFDDLESCFTGNATALLMREIVKKHFSFVNVTKKNVHVFESPLTAQWFSYEKQLSPSFLLCSNGTLDQQQFPGYDCAKFKECMTSLIYYCYVIANIDTVSFDGIQQNAATFFAYRTEPRSSPVKDKTRWTYDIWMQETWGSLKHVDKKSLTQSDRQDSLQSIESLDDFWSEVVKRLLEAKAINRDIYESYGKTFQQSVKLQQNLSLNLRAQPVHNVAGLPKASVAFTQSLCSLAAKMLHDLAEPVAFPVHDLIDGRLYAYLLNLEYCGDHGATNRQGATNLTNRSPTMALLYQMQPLEHGLFELYAKDVAKGINNSLGDNYQNTKPVSDAVLFLERRHWHSGLLIEEDFSKKVYEKKPDSMKKREAMKVNRSKQNLAKWSFFYGETLEGKNQKISFYPPSKEHVKKAATAKLSSKAEQIILKNKKDKLMKKIDEEIKVIEKAAKKKLPIPNAAKFITAEGKATALYHQALLLKQSVLDKCKQLIDEKREASVGLFLTLDELLHKEFDGKKFVEVLSKKNQFIAEQLWCELGFGAEKESIDQNHNMNLDINIIDYRLAYAGQSIEIQSDPVPDDRVEGFLPDMWQRELLDAVDHNQSALIIAPTSAGKTFISYYCIEKVLKETTDGVVVYVCPTKALVNQVAATISARFRHAKLQPGQALCGVFNRDYRKDVHTSRVLITVPQCLEVFFLSPQCLSWCQKLKYAIFDEVHCIGGGVGDILGSEVWEHIILLVNCPFLALSATVGNVEVLHSWLAQAEQAKMGRTRQVKLVQYIERYSELELFLFDIFDLKSKKPLLELNPLAVCKTKKIKQFGLPADQQLTARQIYNLWEAIKSMKNDIGVQLKPSTFFKDVTNVLLRRDIRNYENNLKQRFVEMVKEDQTDEDRLISDLFGNIDVQLAKRSSTFSGVQLAWNGVAELIMCLRDREMLPCLCFSDNRLLCIMFAQKVEEHLQKLQMDFQKLNPELERTLQNRAKQMEKSLKRQRDKKDTGNKEEKDEKQDDESCIIRMEDNAAFKLKKPGADMALYEFVINRLKRKDGDLESTKLLLTCIDRGIGFHHSGMTIAQRQSVEILFRTGHLQVVFSTATLALGIHMPCKSVVLTIDSAFLTPLQYRQMIGRAGRRGFDKSGNVIIYSIPTKKITRLLTAALPNLRANLPFTVSYILRLFALIANVPEAKQKSCMKSISAMLLQPFIVHTLSAQQEALKKQLEHYFVFGCHFLNRMSLINSKMQPIGLAGIVTHLSYHEPGNFIFIYFLQNGAFHTLCKRYSGLELLDKLVLIMSHLFTRTIAQHTKEQRTNYVLLSKIVLGDLPKEFTSLLTAYNNEVTNFYVSFLKNLTGSLFPVCESNDVNCSMDVSLPYSNAVISSPKIPTDNNIKDFVKQNLIGSKLVDTKIGGPIFSITGKDDCDLDLVNLKLVYPLRQGIYYDQGFVPAALNLQKNHRGEPVSLNAYAYDFWKHESTKALLKENKILEGDAYHLLNDFCLVLKSITCAMEELAPKPTTDIVVCTFRSLVDAYEDKFNCAFQKKAKKP